MKNLYSIEKWVSRDIALLYKDIFTIIDQSNFHSKRLLLAHLSREVESALHNQLKHLFYSVDPTFESLEDHEKASTIKEFAENEFGHALRNKDIYQEGQSTFAGEAHRDGQNIRQYNTNFKQRIQKWDDEIISSIIQLIEKKSLYLFKKINTLKKHTPREFQKSLKGFYFHNNHPLLLIFFKDLPHSYDWLQALNTLKIFKYIPDYDLQGNMRSWPQGHYLLETLKKNPGNSSLILLATKILQRVQTNNSRFAERCMSVAALLPPEASSQLLERTDLIQLSTKDTISSDQIGLWINNLHNNNPKDAEQLLSIYLAPLGLNEKTSRRCHYTLMKNFRTCLSSISQANYFTIIFDYYQDVISKYDSMNSFRKLKEDDISKEPDSFSGCLLQILLSISQNLSKNDAISCLEIIESSDLCNETHPSILRIKIKLMHKLKKWNSKEYIKIKSELEELKEHSEIKTYWGHISPISSQECSEMTAKEVIEYALSSDLKEHSLGAPDLSGLYDTIKHDIPNRTNDYLDFFSSNHSDWPNDLIMSFISGVSDSDTAHIDKIKNTLKILKKEYSELYDYCNDYIVSICKSFSKQETSNILENNLYEHLFDIVIQGINFEKGSDLLSISLNNSSSKALRIFINDCIYEHKLHEQEDFKVFKYFIDQIILKSPYDSTLFILGEYLSIFIWIDEEWGKNIENTLLSNEKHLETILAGIFFRRRYTKIDHSRVITLLQNINFDYKEKYSSSDWQHHYAGYLISLTSFESSSYMSETKETLLNASPALRTAFIEYFINGIQQDENKVKDTIIQLITSLLDNYKKTEATIETNPEIDNLLNCCPYIIEFNEDFGIAVLKELAPIVSDLDHSYITMDFNKVFKEYLFKNAENLVDFIYYYSKYLSKFDFGRSDYFENVFQQTQEIKLTENQIILINESISFMSNNYQHDKFEKFILEKRG